jgi:hypothetical protein
MTGATPEGQAGDTADSIVAAGASPKDKLLPKR